MLPLPGLSPVDGKALSARFDGGALSSDAGLLALREVERRLDVSGRLAAGIDADALRADPVFNAHYNDHGFQPIVVFDGAGRFAAAVLRPARRPKGREIAAHLRRLIREIRRHWPRVEILRRGDSHYCAPEVIDFCRAQKVDFILGLASNANLRPGSPRSLLRGVGRRRVATLEHATIARVDHNAGTKGRRFKAFHDAAGFWSRVERIVARGEAGPQGCDSRFPPRRQDRVPQRGVAGQLPSLFSGFGRWLVSRSCR
jgi:hypothetical protein